MTLTGDAIRIIDAALSNPSAFKRPGYKVNKLFCGSDKNTEHQKTEKPRS